MKVPIIDKNGVTHIMLIDIIDYNKLKGKKLNINNDGYPYYAYGSIHRFVMKNVLKREIKPDYHIDHINRNRLDNRRSNLREITQRENQLNNRSSNPKNKEIRYKYVLHVDQVIYKRIKFVSIESGRTMQHITKELVESGLPKLEAKHGIKKTS